KILYWGKNEKYIWGYVELLIILEIYLLTDSMKVYEFLRGDNINELLNFILKQEKDSTSEDLGYLIANSYNYHEVKTSHLNYADLNNERKLLVLRDSSPL